MDCSLKIICCVVIRFLYGRKFSAFCWRWGLLDTLFAFFVVFRMAWRLIRMTIFIFRLLTISIIHTLILWLLTRWRIWTIFWILFLTFCILIYRVTFLILLLLRFLIVLLLRSWWCHHVWLVIWVRRVHHRWHHALVLGILTMPTIIFTHYHLQHFKLLLLKGTHCRHLLLIHALALMHHALMVMAMIICLFLYLLHYYRNDSRLRYGFLNLMLFILFLLFLFCFSL